MSAVEAVIAALEYHTTAVRDSAYGNACQGSCRCGWRGAWYGSIGKEDTWKAQWDAEQHRATAVLEVSA